MRLKVAGASFPAGQAGQKTVPPEGRSLVPAFADKPLDRKYLFWEHEGNRAVSDGKWKLVAKGPGGPWALHDLETDRTEQHDLAATQPDRARSAEHHAHQQGRDRCLHGFDPSFPVCPRLATPFPRRRKMGKRLCPCDPAWGRYDGPGIQQT